MEVWIYSIVSAVIISFCSLLGIVFLGAKKGLWEKVIVALVAFAAATMLGNAFFHFLPEIIEHREGENPQIIGLWIIFGVLIGLLTEKVLHWNHCHHSPDKAYPHTFAKMSLLGDFIHNLMDGMVIGASFLVSIPTGIATSLAILMHEVPQELWDYAILVHGGYEKKKALLLNFLTALSAVIGVVITLSIGHFAHDIEMILLPISLGMFVYIAGTDLIPEVNKHNENLKFSLVQVVIFVVAILITYALAHFAEHPH